MTDFRGEISSKDPDAGGALMIIDQVNVRTYTDADYFTSDETISYILIDCE